jgi:hypothetical protein
MRLLDPVRRIAASSVFLLFAACPHPATPVPPDGRDAGLVEGGSSQDVADGASNQDANQVEGVATREHPFGSHKHAVAALQDVVLKASSAKQRLMIEWEDLRRSQHTKADYSHREFHQVFVKADTSLKNVAFDAQRFNIDVRIDVQPPGPENPGPRPRCVDAVCVDRSAADRSLEVISEAFSDLQNKTNTPDAQIWPVAVHSKPSGLWFTLAPVLDIDNSGRLRRVTDTDNLYLYRGKYLIKVDGSTNCEFQFNTIMSNVRVITCDMAPSCRCYETPSGML